MSAPDAAGTKPSLRLRLARHLLLPLALTWTVGSIVVLTVGSHFATQAFDRALLDDAYALAAHVHQRGDSIALDLTSQEISTLLFDQSEKLFYSLFTADGTRVAGDAGLQATPIPPGATYEFSDLPFGDGLVRSVSLRRDGPVPFVVVMAETTTSRTQLLVRLLVYSAFVQLWLLVVLAWWLSYIIERDLRPLAQLQDAVNLRDARDLAPLPSSLTAGATTRDVERLGDAVNSLLSRLQESLSAQREFAGNVAHELRTPLAGIRAQAAYALAQQDPAAWRAGLQGALQTEERASRLVGQLLALARAGEDSAALQIGTIKLNELVRDVVLRFLPAADARHVDLGAEGLDEEVEVIGDQALIEGILNNLLDNALRYGASESPRVTVALRRDADAATLSVTDNGPGLGAIEAGQLTQRWAQGPSGHALGQGAGLGLAIVQRYAQLLGAQFSLEQAAQGGGLRATLRLPLA